MDKINIKVNKEGANRPHTNNVSNGPELSDIKEPKGRRKISLERDNAPKILKKINKKKLKKLKKIKKKRNYKFRIIYFLIPLLLIILGLVLFLGYYVLIQDRIVKILPENSYFYGKINLKDLGNNQMGSFMGEYFDKDELNLKLSGLANDVLNNFGLNYSDFLSKAIKDEISIASFPGRDNSPSLILAIEVKNKDEVSSFINNNKEVDYINNYSFEGRNINEVVFKDEKGKIYYTFYSNFLILAKSDEDLEKILNIANKKETSLNSSPVFKAAVPYLYKFKDNYFYFNLASFSFKNLKDQDILGIGSDNYFPLYAFLKSNSPISLFFEINEGKLNLIGRAALDNNKAIVKPTNLNMKDAWFYYNSYDLTGDLGDYIKLFNQEDERFGAVEGFANNVSSKYNFDLTSIIEPFFKKNIEVMIINHNNQDELLLTVEVEESEENRESLKKIEKTISYYLGMLYPKEKEFELADGSLGMELIADTEKFRFRDVKLGDTKIRSVVNPGIDQHFAYAFYDNYLLFSTQEVVLEKAIQAKDKNESFLQNESVNNFISEKSYNSLFYLDLKKIYDKIGISDEEPYKHLGEFILRQENKENNTEFRGEFVVE